MKITYAVTAVKRATRRGFRDVISTQVVGVTGPHNVAEVREIGRIDFDPDGLRHLENGGVISVVHATVEVDNGVVRKYEVSADLADLNRVDPAERIALVQALLVKDANEQLAAAQTEGRCLSTAAVEQIETAVAAAEIIEPPPEPRRRTAAAAIAREYLAIVDQKRAARSAAAQRDRIDVAITLALFGEIRDMPTRAAAVEEVAEKVEPVEEPVLGFPTTGERARRNGFIVHAPQSLKAIVLADADRAKPIASYRGKTLAVVNAADPATLVVVITHQTAALPVDVTRLPHPFEIDLVPNRVEEATADVPTADQPQPRSKMDEKAKADVGAMVADLRDKIAAKLAGVRSIDPKLKMDVIVLVRVDDDESAVYLRSLLHEGLTKTLPKTPKGMAIPIRSVTFVGRRVQGLKANAVSPMTGGEFARDYRTVYIELGDT